MSGEQRFCGLLRELFQFAKADLNFGIYRVMNQKRAKMEEIIGSDIIQAVDAALAQKPPGGGDAADDKSEALAWIREILSKGAFDRKGKLKPDFRDGAPGKAWQMLQGDAHYEGVVSTEKMREEVFNRLYDFFSRYYDEGDFLCQQRYAADGRYAVPYNGEEVVMHWANKDQYYIKTAEHFPQYEYRADGVSVRFQMSDAKVEADNNKSNGDKFFIPQAADFAQLSAKQFVLPFVYRSLTTAEKTRHNGGGTPNKSKIQGNIIKQALAGLRANPTAQFLLPEDARKDEQSPLVQHLNRYIKRNTADYFIHKNLHRFLSEELDYFINKELLNAADLVRNNANTQARFLTAQAVRAAGTVTIDFLAQLEEFQKAIWQKKKFITGTDYVITVQSITAADLRRQIAGNDKQWAQWQQLGFFGKDAAKQLLKGAGKEKARQQFLQSHPTLPVDTALFSAEFKTAWLATVENLDDATDGVLFHGENWQTLNILQEKYRGRVKCVYIDPPYNTGPSEILYKNNFKHSAWLSLMADRIFLSDSLQPKQGVLVVAIDENEHTELSLLLKDIFPMHAIHSIAVQHNPQGVQGEHFAYSSEYAVFVAPKIKGAIKNIDVEAREEIFRDDTGNSFLRTDAKNCFYPVLVKDDSVIGFGEVADDDFHPSDRVVKKDGYIEIWPIKDGVERKWRFAKQSVDAIKTDLIVKTTKRGKDIFQIKSNGRPKTMWTKPEYQAGNKHGTGLLSNLLGEGLFDNPKSVKLVEDCIKISSDNDNIVLDYFAGSGTTAHAVINLNREDGGRRKFILAEMGEYFHTVLLPRIKKVIFSPEWTDGAPKRAATAEEAVRTPRVIKYHRFESYDDALDNIQFDEAVSAPLQGLEDYLPRYMLTEESRACATFARASAAFDNPFAYTLRKTNGEVMAATADLPETFAYLLGLDEQTRRTVYDKKRRYVVQTGTADNHATMVLWRDTTGWKDRDFERERDFVAAKKLTAGMARVYVNSDSCIPNAESIMPLFAQRMFADESK